MTLFTSSLQLNDDFIESFCRTLIPMQEVVDVLCRSELSAFTKRIYVKFLSEVYLDTKQSTDVTGVADLSAHE